MVNNQGTPTTPQGSTDIDIPALFKRLGLDTEQSVSGTYNGQWVQSSSGSTIESYNPSTGSLLAKVQVPSTQDVESTIAAAKAAQIQLRRMPAPQRGHILRDIRTALAEHVDDLGMIITLEMGKIKSEGRGEVVEFLDVADIALGLSRQIGGVVLPSERNKHFMGEVANPLGVIGVISAFNFPIAVSLHLPFRLGPCLTTLLTGLWMELFASLYLRQRLHLETSGNHSPLRHCYHPYHHFSLGKAWSSWSTLLFARWGRRHWRQDRS